MQVILLERVAKLGQMGDVVSVKPGYARNYLLPQGKALSASQANIDGFEAQKAQLEARNLETRKEAEALAGRLDGQQFVVIRSASDAGSLYGSVTPRDAAEVAGAEGFSVDRKQVVLTGPIKELGLHRVTVVLHPLADDRRVLPIDRTGELLEAPPSFMLVVSYNPGYQNLLKGMKPSTRQRFVSLRFDFPRPEQEEAVLIGETACAPDLARRLVAIANALRALKDRDLEEAASTRLLVYTALLVKDGMDPVAASRVGIVESLTDDADVAEGLMEVVAATFGR